ncbi:MAG: 2-hydroxyglutaryl-CoA dehydratase [Candidatus Hydromicrobium americanum]|nr:MAG: 2-hydroxyglutaryl-CoA dehydratase [Candidatus Hydromicrobium americanum]
MYTCGIDVGSVSTKVVILGKKDNKIASYVIASTGSNSKNAAIKALDDSLKKAGLTDNEIEATVTTGYGRINIPFADQNITEISCHARGAISLFPDLKTVIDIGGQDSKVIKLKDGKPIDFLMNDKCAAGTGRFLEVMARAMEINIEQFAPIFIKTNDKVDITSTCTVFAESEIVSLIGQGIDKNKIIKGLIYSIADKITSMVGRVGLDEPVCMTGGVAKNLGVVKALEENLGIKINIPDEPQITGALGAAYLAQNLH